MDPHDALTGGASAPAYLPRVPHLFWSVHPDFEGLTLGPDRETPAALERLGPPPFPKTGFPFIGFLATVYDHVASQAGDRAGADDRAGAALPNEALPASDASIERPHDGGSTADSAQDDRHRA